LSIDAALAALYGPSAPPPSAARWFQDIKKCFPQDVLGVLRGDALERREFAALWLEPEVLGSLSPDMGLAARLIAAKAKIPARSLDAARELVRAAAEPFTRKLEAELSDAHTRAVNKQARSFSSGAAVDWHATIKKNLGRYDPHTKALIPQRFVFYRRGRGQGINRVILAIDQSASMAESALWAALTGCALARIKKPIDTRVIAFSSDTVDLTERCRRDPVEALFGLQLGGGTDIGKAVARCAGLVTEPRRTLFVLVSDLFEGANPGNLLVKMGDMAQSGVKCLCLLAGTAYDREIAGKLAALGVTCASPPPEEMHGAIGAAFG
jgi:Mg-chelatase subunit ChlD